MNDCDGCQWWSEMVACSIGLESPPRSCPPIEALCLNTDSCHNSKMVNGGCDKHKAGIAVDSPTRRYQ